MGMVLCVWFFFCSFLIVQEKQKNTFRYRKVVDMSEQDEILGILFERKEFDEVSSYFQRLLDRKIDIDLNYKTVHRLISFFTRKNQVDNALIAFHSIQNPDYGNYNHLIWNLCNSGQTLEFVQPFIEEAKRKKIRLNIVTINALLKRAKTERNYQYIRDWISRLVLSRTLPNEETVYYFLLALGKLEDVKTCYWVMDLVSRSTSLRPEWKMVQFYIEKILSKIGIDERTLALPHVWGWYEQKSTDRMDKEAIEQFQRFQSELRKLNIQNNEGEQLFEIPLEANHLRIRW